MPAAYAEQGLCIRLSIGLFQCCCGPVGRRYRSIAARRTAARRVNAGSATLSAYVQQLNTGLFLKSFLVIELVFNVRQWNRKGTLAVRFYRASYADAAYAVVGCSSNCLYVCPSVCPAEVVVLRCRGTGIPSSVMIADRIITCRMTSRWTWCTEILGNPMATIR